MSLSTKCPSCGKVLKLKSNAAVGRKVPCPQCKEPFVVKLRSQPKAAPPDDEYGDDESGYEDDYGNEYDEYDDAGYDDYEEAPVRSSQSSSSSSGKKSKSKKKKKSGPPAWLMPVLMGCGAIAILGVLATVVSFAVSGLGGSNVVDLSYQPENCDAVLIARPAAMASSPMLTSVMETPFVKQIMQAQTGDKGKPSDVELIVAGFTGLADKHRFNVFNRQPGQVVQKADPKMLFVMRMTRDINADELQNYSAMSGSGAVGNLEEKTHGSQKYFEARTQQATIGIWQANPRTILMGSVDLVTAAIDRGPAQPRLSRIDFVDASQHLVFAFAPEEVLATDTANGVPGSVQHRLELSMNKNIRAVAFGLTVSSDIDVKLQTVCFGSSEATAFKTDLDAVVAEGKSKAESALTSVPPGMETIVEVARSTLASIQSSQSGSGVGLKVKVPGKIIDAVKSAIEANPIAKMMFAAAQTQIAAQQAAQGVTPGSPSPGAGSPGQFPSLPPGDAEAVNLSRNNLRQIGLALHNFHNANNRLPNAASPDDSEQSLLSWRVQLLPFLDQAALYQRFRLNEPWDSANNLPLAQQMPIIFRVPGSSLPADQTTYVVLRGPGTAFATGERATGFRNITDGTSNTLAVVEAAPESAVVWTRPDDLNFDSASPRQGLFGMRPSGLLGLLLDGSVRTFSPTLDDETIRRLATRNDGQVIDPSAF